MDAPKNPETTYKDAWRDESGQRWVRQQERTDAQLGPLGLPALDALALRPGERVLDVGCGAGQTLLQLAERVTPDGWVTGLDISEPLVEHARKRVSQCGLRNVDVVLGDAETKRIEPPFDALFSRFGVMFFEHPGAAFLNLSRSLRSGARVALVCWQSLAENPWASEPLEAVRSLAPEVSLADMLQPDRPGPFRFGSRDLLRSYLAHADLRDVEIVPRITTMLFGGARTVEEAVDFALEVGPAARFVSQMPVEKRGGVRDVLRSVFEPVLTDEGVQMPAATLVVTARVRSA